MAGSRQLEGKVALVTGATRGIGAAVATRLAADGAAVAFTYSKSAEEAAAVQAAIKAAGGRAMALKADSEDAQAVGKALAAAAEAFGKIDILVNNAGIMTIAPLEQLTVADFDRMVAVNVRGLFVAAKAATEHLSSGGRIVAIGSITALKTGFPGASVYAMTKAAVAALARGLAIELAPRGITVNTVHPGPTATERNPDHGPMAEVIKQHIPLRRYARVEEIAALVAHLVGPEAGFITGAAFTIDGGAMA